MDQRSISVQKLARWATLHRMCVVLLNEAVQDLEHLIEDGDRSETLRERVAELERRESLIPPDFADRVAELERKIAESATPPALGSDLPGYVKPPKIKERRHVTPAGRRNISAAQKKRWAEFKRRKSEAKVPVKKAAPKKRKVSPALLAAARKNAAKARAVLATRHAAKKTPKKTPKKTA